MVYVAWATVLSGIVFARRSKLALALAALLGGVVLFVSNLNWLDPQITPLVPVLKSYWLMIHVSVITASYGFFRYLRGLRHRFADRHDRRKEPRGTEDHQRNGDARRAGAADHRHLFRRRLGQRVLGPLLGAGDPEGDLGR